MNGKGKAIAEPEDSPESIGTKTQMRNFPKKIQTVFFGLQWVFLRITVSQDINFIGMYLYALAPSGRSNYFSGDSQRSSGRNPFEHFGIHFFIIDNHLDTF